MSSNRGDEQTERVRNQGKPNGLFRACMDEIRSSHTTGQALRTAAIVSGLLTDRNVTLRCWDNSTLQQPPLRRGWMN